MKKKTFVYASFGPDANSTTKGFWVSQKTGGQHAVIRSASTCKSLTIDACKGTVATCIHVQNSIVLS
jgi:hypothetical protein